MKNYKLGKIIQRIRCERGIVQENLCYGICPVAVLSKMESVKKNTDIIFAKAILGRLGVYSEKFMYIIDDTDFELYEQEVYIRKHIKEKNYNAAEEKLKIYEDSVLNYKNIYYQFIYKCRAVIQKNTGNILEAKKLFKTALEETVPDFENIELEHYYLNNEETDILLEYIQLCIDTENKGSNIKGILINTFKIMDMASINELGKNRLYPKVCSICADILISEKNFDMCQNITKRGLEALVITNDLNFRADLIFYNTICSLKLNPHNDYMSEFLDAYFIAEFMEQKELVRKIEQIVKEVYGWESIEKALLSS